MDLGGELEKRRWHGLAAKRAFASSQIVPWGDAAGAGGEDFEINWRLQSAITGKDDGSAQIDPRTERWWPTGGDWWVALQLVVFVLPSAWAATLLSFEAVERW